MSIANLPKPSQVKPPDKGSFPLDHFGQCKDEMQSYMSCLRENDNKQQLCKQLAVRYFQCRMDKKLMDKEELDGLGYHQAATDAPGRLK